jgi:hypothetical protein
MSGLIRGRSELRFTYGNRAAAAGKSFSGFPPRHSQGGSWHVSFRHGIEGPLLVFSVLPQK